MSLLLSLLALALELSAEPAKAWMKTVDGRLKLSEMMIPGTHDSCALYGGIYGQCQKMSLEAQLKAGVRFLDIRCRRIEDRFQIHHGMIDQRLTFAEVRDQCEAFLAKHPSECILMSIKAEHTAVDNTLSFGDIFKKYIEGHEQWWYAKNQVPRLEQVRGKIVVVSRNSEVAGLPWREVKVQDHYKVSGQAGIDKKWQQVKAVLEREEKAGAKKLVVNFCSGSSLLSPPKRVAAEINQRLSAYLKEQDAAKPCVLVLDFAESKLVSQIYQKNEGAFTD